MSALPSHSPGCDERKVEIMRNGILTLAALLLTALFGGAAWGAVAGCAAATDDYRPYGQWQDLPANLDGLTDYVPITYFSDYADPMVVNETTEATDVTIILMHGKNGSPWFSNQIALANELAALGFKVVAPTMPWGRKLYYTLNADRTDWVSHTYFAWDGDMCQAMNYIQTLVADERALNRRVLLMGHSMGGRHALIYGYLNEGDDILGVITSAPGGLIPLARRAMTETAASREKAKNLVSAGDGDVLETFQTLNTNGLQTITTTANIYRTYHEPDPDAVPDRTYSPDISNVLANVTEPVLWVVGTDDALKTFYESNNLFGRLPQNSENRYRVLPGDHLSVLLNESTPIYEWFTSWSAISPADNEIFQNTLEVPGADETYTGIANIQGWAVSTNGIEKVEIYLDGQYLFDVPYGGRRDDVALSFPEVANAENSGYSMAFGYTNLSEGMHTLTSRAISESGEVKDSTTTFYVDKYHKPFIGGGDTVNASRSLLTASGDRISVLDITIDGRRYDLYLQWNTATQGFEIYEISPY